MNCLKFSLTLAIAAYFISYSNAQTFENKKIGTVTFKDFRLDYNQSVNSKLGFPAVTTAQSEFGIRPQITYGKVNSKNVLFAYGVEFHYGLLIVKPTTRRAEFGASPMMVIQKFIRLSDVFYLSPSFVAMGGYFHSKTTFSESESYQEWRRFHASLNLIPISLTYVFNPKINIVLSLGQFSLNYKNYTLDNRVDVFNSFGIAGGEFELNDSGLNYFAGIDSVSLGFQFLF